MKKNPKQSSTDKSSGRKRKQRAKSAKRERSRWRWLWFGLKTAVIMIGGVIVLGLGAGTGYAAALLKGLPKISAKTFTNLSQPSIVYDRSGNVIGKFAKDGNRTPLKNLTEVSPHLVNAFIAAEDRTFWTNKGINPVAMGRAFFQDITTHHIESGASTITQQTVKLAVFPEQQRTIKRKVQEIALALKLNNILTKKEIMTDYMNWVYMGQLGPNPVYGVQAAAKILFHKDVQKLNLPEATVIASIPNNPSYYSPYIYTKSKGWSIDLTHIKQRQQYILNQMLTHNMITQSQYNSALNFNLKKDIHLPTAPVNQKYQYLMQDEIPYIVAQDLGYPNTQKGVTDAKNVLATGGYRIYTTIDKSIQDHVKKVLSDSKWYSGTLRTYSYKNNKGKTVQIPDQYQTGATVIDNKTGAILAIGGGNPHESKKLSDDVDHSDIAEQPGSSIKPLLDYGPAIDMHVLTAASPIIDAPYHYPGTNKQVHDAEYGWRGIVSARTALVQSYNVPAIKVLSKVGVANGDKYLAKMGINGNSKTIDGNPTFVSPADNKRYNDQNLATAIGGLTHGLTTQQMASAYTVFSNQGVWKQSYMVAKITNSSGQTVFKNKQTVRQVFSPQTAYILDSIMRDVVLKGTATLVGNHFGSTPVYGKTGTTDKQEDGWFVGFTQDYTTALWTGYDYQRPIPGGVYNRKFYIWNTLMDPLVKQEHPKPIQNPGGIVSSSVCKYSGMLPSPLCKQLPGAVHHEIFIKGTQPTKTGKVVQQVEYTVYKGKKYLATTKTPPAQIQTGIFIKPWFKPGNVKTNTSHLYLPTKPDPRGGTVLQPLSTNQIVKPPQAPQNLQSTVQQGQVQLHWDPVNGAGSYSVYRATSKNGPYSKVTSAPVTSTTYVDTSVPSGTSTVYYEVFAIQNRLRSNPSSPLQVNLPTGGGPSAGAGSGGGVGGSGSATNPTGSSPASTSGSSAGGSSGTSGSGSNSGNSSSQNTTLAH